MAQGYTDRRHAGRVLADEVAARVGLDPGVVVLALPRGGVPVAHEVAQRLGAPLDVLVVRKLGVPGHEELAMGAIASGGSTIVDHGLARRLGIADDDLASVIAVEQRELARREATYRGGRPAPDLAGRTVVLVDDGLATGSTMRAAVGAVRSGGPRRVVVAVPVGAPQACDAMQGIADEVVCPLAPSGFTAVGYWYDDFSQTGDDEVQALLFERSGG